MTKLPDKDLLDGTKKPETTTGEFRLAMGNIRQFLFELFGDESSDKETARQTLGIDIGQLKEGIASKADKQTVEMALEEKADKKDLSLVATTGDYNHLVNKPEKSDTLEGYGIIADTTPTVGSTRPVTSEGIKDFVENRISGIQHGMRSFYQSGTFVVPEGVTSLKVWCIGGGGGGNFNNGDPGNGGNTTFGDYITAYGGQGGHWGANGTGGTAGICSQNSYVTRAGSGGNVRTSYIWGPSWIATTDGQGQEGSHYSGGSGSSVFAILKVTPGEGIQVNVGAGGWSSNGGGSAGLCYVEW